MKILHLSSASPTIGAGLGALNTHYSLLKMGVESRIMFFMAEVNHEEHIYSFVNTQSFAARIMRLCVTSLERLPLLAYRNRRNQIFSPGKFGFYLANHELVEWADVIHIHWANHGFIDVSRIVLWNKPVVWTLRDMWAFTGGCHHSFECVNFKKECGNCPVLNSKSHKDLSYYTLRRKLKYFKC
jgi:hypothetical protein